MKKLIFAFAFLGTVLSALPAEALPRFAARNGLRCLKCHVNPHGGGPRNRYGADVFALNQLGWGPDEPEQYVTVEEIDGYKVPFSGAITSWLSVGGDLRLAYFLAAPKEAREPDAAARISTTFFLMQADLYHVITPSPYLTLAFDIGVNSGFEAWAMLRPLADISSVDVFLRAGRFLPALGLRNVNHSLFTRQSVGLGPSSQDTGLELTLDAEDLLVTIAVFNGALGSPFDSEAMARRTFDKAALARASVRFRSEPVSAEFGGSAYFNQNATMANPVFGIDAAAARVGVDELRLGGHLIAGAGPFALLGDVAFIENRAADGSFSKRQAGVAYAELSMHLMAGLDVLAGFEVLRPTLNQATTETRRWSLAAEVFPWPFTEVRVMARYQHGPGTPGGRIIDVVAFLHVFL